MSALAVALAEVGETSARLSHLSQRGYQNPYVHMEQWPESVDPEKDWFSTPEYLSLYGTPLWTELDEAARRRVAFHEAAGFYSLNIHGEKSLMQGLAARLYRTDLAEITGYLHHFLDEENKHSVYFGGFCTRYARVYRSRQIALGTPHPRDVDDFLFFTRTLIFEEIVDHLNRVQARDSRLHPLARFINDSHHRDEARHLVFGRCLVTALWKACAPGWSPEVIGEIRDALGHFFTATWREHYHPDVYADAGLDAQHAKPTAVRGRGEPGSPALVIDARHAKPTAVRGRGEPGSPALVIDARHAKPTAVRGRGEPGSPALVIDNPWELAESAWAAPVQRARRRIVSARCLNFLAAAGILEQEPADAF